MRSCVDVEPQTNLRRKEVLDILLKENGTEWGLGREPKALCTHIHSKTRLS